MAVRAHNTGSHLATFYNTARYHFVSMRVVSIVCPNLIPSPLFPFFFFFFLFFAPQRHFNARLKPPTFSTSGRRRRRRWWWWLFIGMMSRPTTVVQVVEKGPQRLISLHQRLRAINKTTATKRKPQWDKQWSNFPPLELPNGAGFHNSLSTEKKTNLILRFRSLNRAKDPPTFPRHQPV